MVFIFQDLEILVEKQIHKDFKRGYGYQGGATEISISELVAELKYGPELKEAILKPGEWDVNLIGFW